jgi:hypothetical protein
MQTPRRKSWLFGGSVWLLGLAMFAGCQLEPISTPAPEPYYPKDALQFFPSRPKREYTFSDEAAALKPDPLEAKSQAKSN